VGQFQPGSGNLEYQLWSRKKWELEMNRTGGPIVINLAMEISLDESTKPENTRGVLYVVSIEATNECGLLPVLLKGAGKDSQIFYAKNCIFK